MDGMRDNSRGGFTLPELIVVLVIVGTLIGVTLPNFGRSWVRLERKDFVLDMARTLRKGRLQAMNSGQPVTFRINGGERYFRLENGKTHPFPPNVELNSEGLEQDVETDEFIILFYPDGSHNGKDLQVIFDDKDFFRISPHPLSGKVTWREETG
jgi:prepilin-type N-terminal cleavage/methylation domain-containing protein